MDKPPDNNNKPDEPTVFQSVMIGVMPEDATVEDFVSTVTNGRTRRAGDLAGIAIVPGALADGSAGLLLSITYPRPEGNVVHVGRISYHDFIGCVAAVVRCMEHADLLKHEHRGPHMQSLLDQARAALDIPEPTSH